MAKDKGSLAAKKTSELAKEGVQETKVIMGQFADKTSELYSQTKTKLQDPEFQD